jgi:hypothetical protein
MAVGLSGMVQRGLGGRRMMMDACMVVALSGVVVVSTAGTGKIMRIFILKIARWFVGGDDFCSLCMRCSLRAHKT